jgi:DNA-binding HxlR family transcriptional regulator
MTAAVVNAPSNWHAAGQAISLVSGKWVFPVLAELADSPKSYNELARAVGTDHKTLARALSRLQADGLVQREPCERPRVTYRLAPRARAMADLVEALACWWQPTYL